MADEAADITAATTTAVSGPTVPLPTGARSRAISSSEALRKKTRRPSTKAGTSSRARTSRGQTSALSSPNAPAPAAAVIAIRVALSPSADWSRKSGRTAARTTMVTVPTAQTTSTRNRPMPTVRHRGTCTPLSPHVRRPHRARGLPLQPVTAPNEATAGRRPARRCAPAGPRRHAVRGGGAYRPSGVVARIGRSPGTRRATRRQAQAWARPTPSGAVARWRVQAGTPASADWLRGACRGQDGRRD